MFSHFQLLSSVLYLMGGIWFKWASQVTLVVKNSPANEGDVRDTGSVPGSGRSPGGGHSNPLQCSCLESPMDRGAWGATVHGVAWRRTRLSDGASTAHHFNGAKLVRTDPASQLGSSLFKGIVISTFILTNFIYREIIFCCYLLVFMNCHTIYMHEQKFTKLPL